MIEALKKRYGCLKRRFEELNDSKKAEYVWVGRGENPCKNMQ